MQTKTAISTSPNTFTQKLLGKTLVTRTAGTKIASDGLRGRIFEVSLADQLLGDGLDNEQ
uniref:Uncharacterized protein n=2 Tax=Physcomitrium patens TaxID=3218 RepID=A0A7I4CAA5_PHYPA